MCADERARRSMTDVFYGDALAVSNLTQYTHGLRYIRFRAI